MFPEFAVSVVSAIHLLSPNTGTVANAASLIDWKKTFLVVAMAVGVNLLYAVGRRKLTNIEKIRRYTQEMKAFRSEMSGAMREGDKQKQEKLKKKQQQMNKMQMEMSKEQLKPTLLFMIPLWGVYILMSNYIGTAVPLAISPVWIPIIFGYSMNSSPQMIFFWWYLICSFTFSTLISRLFGLTFDS